MIWENYRRNEQKMEEYYFSIISFKRKEMFCKKHCKNIVKNKGILFFYNLFEIFTSLMEMIFQFIF